MLYRSDFEHNAWNSKHKDPLVRLSRALSLLENGHASLDNLLGTIRTNDKQRQVPVVGITGTGGAGKSSLTDELLARFLWDDPEIRIAVLCVDPSKRKTGALFLATAFEECGK